MKPFSVLFVCMGNICRSTTAHGVFRKDGFEQVLDLVEDASEGLLRHVRAQVI